VDEKVEAPVVPVMPVIKQTTFGQQKPSVTSAALTSNRENAEEVKLENAPSAFMVEVEEVLRTGGKCDARSIIIEHMKSSGTCLRTIFNSMDKSNDGSVTIKELGKTFDGLRIADAVSIMKVLDKDGDF